MKPLRVCSVSGCPEVANGSGMCPPHRAKQRREADRRVGRVRGSQWTKIRRQVLQSWPWCACTGCKYCEQFAVHRVPAEEVDHKIPLREGGHPTALSNLQGLCHECHLVKTKEEHSRVWED